MTDRQTFVSIDLGGKPALIGRLWARSRRGLESATFEYDRQWLANPASNFGMLLKSEEALQQARFASSEDPSRVKRPQLVLTALRIADPPRYLNLSR